MGVPTVIPMTSKEGFATWPAQDSDMATLAVFDQFYAGGMFFVGEITIDGGKYWLFKQPTGGS